MTIEAPAATPPEIVNRIATDVTAALVQPRVAQTLIEPGADPVGNGPEAFRRFPTHEISRWSVIVRAAGASPA